jgi:hypothetical protein
MDDKELKAAVIRAGEDEHGIAVRREVCEALALAFRKAGEGLWLCGLVIGSDRVGGGSPFGFGSDATVGLGTVVQIAGELSAGVVALLDQGNRYGAAALLRQLVEVEYLTWAFAEDEDEAMNWTRSTREERLRFWQPRHIRDRAKGRFRGIDYALHCEKGGHPSPEGNRLLPGHNGSEPDFFAWNDLAFHGQSAWDYTLAAADKLDYGDEMRGLAAAQALAEAQERRRYRDPLVPLLAEVMEILEASQSSTGV